LLAAVMRESRRKKVAGSAGAMGAGTDSKISAKRKLSTNFLVMWRWLHVRLGEKKGVIQGEYIFLSGGLSPRRERVLYHAAGSGSSGVFQGSESRKNAYIGSVAGLYDCGIWDNVVSK